MNSKKFLLTVTALSTISAQSAVVIGDLAVVGYQADGTDRFWILALNEISAGEVFNFTDNGWLNSGSFRGGEGHKEYTVAAALGVGDILEIALSEGTGTTPNFAGGGDQVFIYTGSAAAPVFVYGLNNEGSGTWQSDASSSNTSALPPTLTEAQTAPALNEIDNAVFDFDANPGPFTASEWLEVIADRDSWTGSNSEGPTPSVTSVTVTPVPEPSSALLTSLALLGLLRRRR